ncbi:hypothetical protein [Nocardia alni]|uniref:hypothetical protein n=1 Tax=Nocardia alni TaxID=2815723 RepID=UPI001C24F099|nr:hypothetical protein [Nocardia alni]
MPARGTGPAAVVVALLAWLRGGRDAVALDLVGLAGLALGPVLGAVFEWGRR